ncbi:SpoIIE family protein phosphatase [Streptomyces sp. NPDC058290]|uniref:SpoIIE family protein phosphatase n=1 Tax=Streptomyces sp. NPDC058290 TaxID=3346426 RepID=UPI0036EE81D9
MNEPVRAPGPDPSSAQNELVRSVRALSEEIAELRAGRADRHLLDLATGILVVQLSVPPADAADHLRRLATQAGVDPSDVAADIVNAAAGSASAAPVRAPAEEDRGAARRVRRTDAAIASADVAKEAVASLLEGGLRPLGARAVWLWRRTTTDCLQLAAQAGGNALQSTHWQWLPAHVGGPLRTALVDGRPVWLPAGTEDGQPLPGPAPDCARAVLPLRHQGAVTGVLLATWAGPTAFDAPMRRAVEGICDTAARVLDAAPDPDGFGHPGLLGTLLDCLVHAALALSFDEGTSAWRIEHANPVAAQQLCALPEPAGRALAEVLPGHCAELVRMLEQARANAAPGQADRLADRDGNALNDVLVLPLGPVRAVLLWNPADESALLLPRVLDRLDHMALFEDDLVSGRSHWSERAYTVFGVRRDAAAISLRELAPRLHPGDTAELAALIDSLTGRQEGAQAVVRVFREDGGMRHVRIAAEPLVKEATAVAVTGIYQDVSALHRTEVALGATYDQLTAVQAQAAVRHQLVLELQEAIVPEVPKEARLPGLLVTARYRPAAEDYRVGGDWYDVLPLSEDRVMLAVGDIAGHGIESATAMVALRNALRGLAFTGNPPGHLMGWLNEVALATSGHPTATALCALYEPRPRLLRWASAGHLPLLLLREGRASLLDPPHDILLGAVPSVAYTESVTALHPGDLLIFYTDGLVERRHGALDEGLALLAGVVERLADLDISDLADRLLTEVRGDTDDDTSMVLIQVA